MIKAKYAYVPRRQLWTCAVYNEDVKGRKEMVTFGVEYTKAEIINWGNDAVECMRNGEQLPPDAHDRRKAAH